MVQAFWGVDLDQVLVKICEKQVKAQARPKNGSTDGLSAELIQSIRKKLLRPCERAKQVLSSDLSTTVKVDALIAGDSEFADLDFECEITRADYEEAAKPIFNKLEAPIVAALEDAQMDMDELDEIVIVGGSTRTPYVK